MARTRKGRTPQGPRGPQRDGSTRRTNRIENSNENEHNTTELDLSTVPDDDPVVLPTAPTETPIRTTPSARSPRQTHLSASDVDDDDEDDSEEEQSVTPRKGADKKRQRFAASNEIFELEAVDGDSSDAASSVNAPTPVTLLDRMDEDVEEVTADTRTTIAAILSDGPQETVRLPERLNMRKDCRYMVIISVPACDQPMEKLAERYTALFKWLQSKVGNALSIAAWEDVDGKPKTYRTPKDLPKPTEISAWTAIYGQWVDLHPKDDALAFVKIRFTTVSPDVLTYQLPNLGTLHEQIKHEVKNVKLNRHPIACQAVDPTCVGWLFGSNRWINSDLLLQEIIKMSNLPPNVRVGLQWRAIRLPNGKAPKWTDGIAPSSALHLDMDSYAVAAYQPEIAKLFKKHGSSKPLGLNLRLIPCFRTDLGKNATLDEKESFELMRDKQDYLIKHHLVKTSTSFILNLDKPTRPGGKWTLRRYLRNLHPEGLVAQRLILSVDKAWGEGKNVTNIVTNKEYAAEVQTAISNMIPECAHRFGKGIRGWFSNEALMTFKDVKWDPNRKKTISDRDVDAKRQVEEDFFGMGTAWRKATHQPSTRPTNTATAPSSSTQTTPQLGTPAASIPTTKDKSAPTINAVLDDLTNRKTHAASFGELYQRPHDGDTAKTSQAPGDDMSLSSKESDTKTGGIRFDGIPAESGDGQASRGGDASTAKSSTHYRLQRDASRKIAAQSRAESLQLLEELRAAREEIDRLHMTGATTTSSTRTQLVTPSATREAADTAADGVGKRT